MTVVGVHSAKFDNEKTGDHVKDAVARYDIHHPVCNDTTGYLWSTLAITCWPTQLLLCPQGRPVAVAMGEGQAEVVEELVQAMLEFYGERGSLTSSGVVGESGGEVGVLFNRSVTIVIIKACVLSAVSAGLCLLLVGQFVTDRQYC